MRRGWKPSRAKPRKHRKAGDHAGRAVEIAALRHRIEMRSAGDERQRGSVPSRVTTRLAPSSRSVAQPEARALASTRSSAAISPGP